MRLTDLNRPIGTIEQSDNAVYAIWTADGPAIYATLDDLLAARDNEHVEIHQGDEAYYEDRAERSPWLEVTQTLGDLVGDPDAPLVDAESGRELRSSDGTPDRAEQYRVLSYHRESRKNLRSAIVAGPSGDRDLWCDDAAGGRLYRDRDVDDLDESGLHAWLRGWCDGR